MISKELLGGIIKISTETPEEVRDRNSRQSAIQRLQAAGASFVTASEFRPNDYRQVSASLRHLNSATNELSSVMRDELLHREVTVFPGMIGQIRFPLPSVARSSDQISAIVPLTQSPR